MSRPSGAITTFLKRNWRGCRECIPPLHWQGRGTGNAGGGALCHSAKAPPPSFGWSPSPRKRGEEFDVKILGLDPGLGTTGWGLIAADGNRLSHLANGEFKTSPASPLPARLAKIADQLEALLAEHRPDGAAVEEVFVNK